MLAQEMIKECVRSGHRGQAHIRAIIPEKDSWWHVHRDEEIPADRSIQVVIRYK